MTSDERAVLGRYGGGDGQADELVHVRLVNFPLQLFASAREHHDELLREFALLALRPPTSTPDREVPTRLLDLIDVLGRQYAGAGDRTDADRDAAVERGETSMDLSYDVPRSIGAGMLRLHELMEQADEFCRTEQLLTLEASPDERRFRSWFLTEFVRQADGHEPTAWRLAEPPEAGPAGERSGAPDAR